MTERAPSPLTGLAAALLAFAFYGAWAAWVNWSHGVEVALRALVAQGAASFTTTFVLAKLVGVFYRRLPAGGVRVAAAPVLSSLAVGCGLALVHWAVGTPALLATIAPSLIMGFGYCVFCTYDLVRIGA